MRSFFYWSFLIAAWLNVLSAVMHLSTANAIAFFMNLGIALFFASIAFILWRK